MTPTLSRNDSMKTPKLIDLAAVFTQIEIHAQATDNVAGQILLAARAANADTVDAFNNMVYAAYDVKGWSHRMGRPIEGDVSAPSSVKTYVSEIRKAYNNGVKVLDFESIGELRKATRIARSQLLSSAPAAPTAKTPPELKGVTVQNGGSLSGHLFHDAIVLWENLPKEQQAAFEDKLQKLVAQYTRKAPPALRIAA